MLSEKSSIRRACRRASRLSSPVSTATSASPRCRDPNCPLFPGSPVSPLRVIGPFMVMPSWSWCSVADGAEVEHRSALGLPHHGLAISGHLGGVVVPPSGLGRLLAVLAHRGVEADTETADPVAVAVVHLVPELVELVAVLALVAGVHRLAELRGGLRELVIGHRGLVGEILVRVVGVALLLSDCLGILDEALPRAVEDAHVAVEALGARLVELERPGAVGR